MPRENSPVFAHKLSVSSVSDPEITVISNNIDDNMISMVVLLHCLEDQGVINQYMFRT